MRLPFTSLPSLYITIFRVSQGGVLRWGSLELFVLNPPMLHFKKALKNKLCELYLTGQVFADAVGLADTISPPPPFWGGGASTSPKI